MMQTRNKILLKSLVAVCCALLPMSAVADTAKQQPATVKKERNAINAGNKLYNDKKYAEAEVQYRKALEANPNSEVAQFNLASSLIKQDKPMPQMGGGEQQMSQTMQEAVGLLQKISDTSTSKKLASKASYDLGNIAYHQQNFAEAITHYKQALRKNPDNNDARYNLRLAQLKKQQQDQNKDKNNQDKNKDQNKDQNKDKNQDQNKDKQDQDKKNQDKKDQQKQDQDKKDQQKQDQQKQQQQQPKDGISKQNMDRILQTMQDKERETQQKMNARKAQMQRSERARTRNKW